jgi:hypothetical protein
MAGFILPGMVNEEWCLKEGTNGAGSMAMGRAPEGMAASPPAQLLLNLLKRVKEAVILSGFHSACYSAVILIFSKASDPLSRLRYTHTQLYWQIKEFDEFLTYQGAFALHGETCKLSLYPLHRCQDTHHGVKDGDQLRHW